MNKLFPKLGLFLIIVANATPVFAASKYQNTSLLNQQIAHQQSSQPIITAGIFKDVKKLSIQLIELTAQQTKLESERRKKSRDKLDLRCSNENGN